MTLDDIANAPGGFLRLPLGVGTPISYAMQDALLSGHVQTDYVSGVFGLRITQAGRDALGARWADEMAKSAEEAVAVDQDCSHTLRELGARKVWLVVRAAVHLVDSAEAPDSSDAVVEGAARMLRRAVAELRGNRAQVEAAMDFIDGLGGV